MRLRRGLVWPALAALALAGCVGPSPNPGPLAPGAHTVELQYGQSLYDVAQTYQVPLRDLIEVNHLRAPYFVPSGSVLLLPNVREYTAARGDTLTTVAQRFGVPEGDIVDLNHIDPARPLMSGQRLRIPGGPTGPFPTAVAAAPGAPVPSGPSAPTPIAGPSATSGSGSGGGVVTAEPLAPLSPPPAPSAAPPPPAPPPPEVASIPPTPPAPEAAAGRFRWPLTGRILSGYGSGQGGNNDGINIEASRGAAIAAAADGDVVYAGNELRGYGNLVLVRHADGFVTAYAHAERLLVREGDHVTAGQRIATVGSSGSVTAPQLHFEVRRGVEPVNPLDHLPPQPASSSSRPRR